MFPNEFDQSKKKLNAFRVILFKIKWNDICTR